MELPEIGSHCAFNSCKLNDFLPFTCQHCTMIFCKNHFNIISHNCSKISDNIVLESGKSLNNYICSKDDCKISSPIEVNCPECKKHFCIGHRHHGCFEETQEQISKKIKQWEKPKEEFTLAKLVVDEKINENLRKSKNSKMANKVQLMRLKGRAVGSKEIPTADRRYFFVHLPISMMKKEPQAVFVCVRWTIGKAIDFISDILKIRNLNNLANAEKLRMFHHLNGKIVDEKMDKLLLDLFDNNQLIDGENLIFEYSNNETVDTSLYV